MSHLADQIHYQTVGETRNHALGFIGRLDSGELLTGTPIILEVTTAILTIASEAVSTTTLTIDGTSHTAGQALQCSVTGATAGEYQILWECATDSSPAQTVQGKTTIIIEAE